MSTIQQTWVMTPPATGMDGAHWYAIHTRARHEKSVAHRLADAGITTFLPLVTETHRWSDRKKTVELPLFSCYVFARFTSSSPDRLRVCMTDGVLQVLGTRSEGSAIPEEQIDAIRTLVSEGLPWSEYPFLKIGQRVRIRSGALNGVEGILVGRNGDRSLVVSVDVIQRSLSVRIEGYDVEPL